MGEYILYKMYMYNHYVTCVFTNNVKLTYMDGEKSEAF